MDLQKYQKTLSSLLRKGEVSNKDLESLGALFPGHRASQGLEIYRHNIRSGFFNTLSDTYPITRIVLGEEQFLTACSQYLDLYPSRHQNLLFYGEHFPNLLKRYTGDFGAPYAPALASLEWYWERAFYAAEDVPLTFHDLEPYLTRNPESIFFKLRSTGAVLQSEFDVLKIWQKRERVGVKSPQLLLVWRDGDTQKIELVEKELWPIMRGIRNELSLAELILLPEIKSNPPLLKESLIVLIERQWLASMP